MNDACTQMAVDYVCRRDSDFQSIKGHWRSRGNIFSKCNVLCVSSEERLGGLL